MYCDREKKQKSYYVASGNWRGLSVKRNLHLVSREGQRFAFRISFFSLFLSFLLSFVPLLSCAISSSIFSRHYHDRHGPPLHPQPLARGRKLHACRRIWYSVCLRRRSQLWHGVPSANATSLPSRADGSATWVSPVFLQRCTHTYI